MLWLFLRQPCAPFAEIEATVSSLTSAPRAEEEVVAYFDKSVALFKSLPTYSWLTAAGIVPSTTATYTLAQLQAVASARTGKQAVWNCRSGALSEVWYGYTTTGPIEGGTFTPASPVGSLSTCPS